MRLFFGLQRYVRMRCFCARCAAVEPLHEFVRITNAFLWRLLAIAAAQRRVVRLPEAEVLEVTTGGEQLMQLGRASATAAHQDQRPGNFLFIDFGVIPVVALQAQAVAENAQQVLLHRGGADFAQLRLGVQ